jgi:DNA-binding response OmpR family regulator
MNYRALAFDPNTCLEKDLKRTAEVEFSMARSTNELYASVDNNQPDLVLLHIDLSQTKTNKLIKSLRKHSPNMPTILIAADSSPAWQQTFDPLMDLVRSPVSPIELHWRIAHLMSRVRPTIEQPYNTRVKVLALKELRNKKTGRLDAALIVKAFGLSTAELGRSISRSRASIHKTPDSASLQQPLYAFERIASAIKHMTGALQPGLKIWLNAPNDDFAMELPVNIIKQGHVPLLADGLEDALLGHPD